MFAKSEIASEKNSKIVYGCMVESHDSTRQRVESSELPNHEDHIAGKGCISMSHYNSVHKFIPMPQVMKIPDAKAAADKECKKLETIEHGIWKKSIAKKGGYSGSTKREKECPLCHIDGHVTSRMRRWNHNYTSTKAESCSVEM